MKQNTTTTEKINALMNSNITRRVAPCNQLKVPLPAGSLLTGHAGVPAQAAVQLAVNKSGVKKPLAKQVEDAVDLWPRRGRQGPGLPAALVGAGQQSGGG